MQDYFYAIVGLAGIFVQLILNGPVMFPKNGAVRVNRFYRAFNFRPSPTI